MTRLSREDVIKAVGSADDITIAQIVATDASAEELAEAKAWIANDEPLMNEGRPLPSGRVGELIEILTELDADADDDGRGAGPAG